MSQHPEVEAKILAELGGLELTITPERPHPRKMTYADMNQLTYLQAAIKVRDIPSFPPQPAAAPSDSLSVKPAVLSVPSAQYKTHCSQNAGHVLPLMLENAGF